MDGKRESIDARRKVAVEGYEAPDGVGTRDGGRPSMLSRFLAVRLATKILVANAVLVVGAMLLTAAAGRLAPGSLERWAVVAPLVVSVALVGVAINAVLVRLALDPLRELETAAQRVAAGDLDARARRSPFADRDMEALVGVFNGMLDNIGAYRQGLRTIAARALDAAEEERKRIAQELYDDTAQALTELLIRLRLAHAAPTEAARDAAFAEFRDGLTAAIERMRQSASELRPPSLDMLGLGAAVSGHAKAVGAPAGMRIDVHAEPISGLLSRAAELALYRIIQEALNNAARHSGADVADVRIVRDGDRVVATIEDFGRGFSLDEAEAEGARAVGLLGMRERAAWVGGHVHVLSQPGRGTRVEVEVPVLQTTEV